MCFCRVTFQADSLATRDLTTTRLLLSYSADGNFSLSIVIKGTQQDIYKPISLANNSSTGYVESRDGEEYSIRFDDYRKPREEDLSVGFFIDGEKMKGSVLSRLDGKDRVCTVRGKRVSEVS